MFSGFDWVLWALLIVATATDLMWGKIYNALTLPTLFAGLLSRFFINGFADLGVALTAIALSFVLFYPLYLLKTWAAGDVKLLLAVAAWSNLELTIRLGAIAIVLGAIVGLALLIKTRGLHQAKSSLGEHFQSARIKTGYRMPFAPAIFCSFVFLHIAHLKHWNIF